eukprot:987569-Pleurochrysis_carterae.AAC.1
MRLESHPSIRSALQMRNQKIRRTSSWLTPPEKSDTSWRVKARLNLFESARFAKVTISAPLYQAANELRERRAVATKLPRATKHFDCIHSPRSTAAIP